MYLVISYELLYYFLVKIQNTLYVPRMSSDISRAFKKSLLLLLSCFTWVP